MLGGNNLTWKLEGLEKFTNYCVQVWGFNSKGDGNTSDSICVLTDEDGKRKIISLNLRPNQKVFDYSPASFAKFIYASILSSVEEVTLTTIYQLLT